MNKQTFAVPENIERYLASLPKLYVQDGKRNLQEIGTRTNRLPS